MPRTCLLQRANWMLCGLCLNTVAANQLKSPLKLFSVKEDWSAMGDCGVHGPPQRSAKGKKPVPKGHLVCDSMYTKQPEQAKAEGGWPGLGLQGVAGVSFWAKESVRNQRAVLGMQTYRYSKCHRTTCCRMVRFMCCGFLLNF